MGQFSPVLVMNKHRKAEPNFWKFEFSFKDACSCTFAKRFILRITNMKRKRKRRLPTFMISGID
jgi:hypothetical protein